MTLSINYVTLLVRDYDAAIAYFTNALGFNLIQDSDLGDGKRWVRVSPPDSGGTEVLLAEASTPELESLVGNQAGGRVFLFLHTDDFQRDYSAMKTRGVEFTEAPRKETYGTVAVFKDLCGNKWDLLELSDDQSAMQ